MSSRIKSSFLILVVLLIIFDQLSKLIIISFDLVLQCNQGFAFGAFATARGTETLLLYAVHVIFILAAVYLFYKNKGNIERIGYLLVIGGGASNLIDRIARGCVVDFINFDFLNLSFNMADVFITLGVLVLLVKLSVSVKNQDENG